MMLEVDTSTSSRLSSPAPTQRSNSSSHGDGYIADELPSLSKLLLTSPSRRSPTSIPFLQEAEDDNDNEIILFGDPSEHEEEELNFDYDIVLNASSESNYDNDIDSSNSTSHLPKYYTRNELNQMVTYVQSSKDSSTGRFRQDRKSLAWCLSRTNSCEQIEPGVWSGKWYFTYRFGEEQGQRAWSEAQNSRLVMERFGKARTVDEQTMEQVLHYKERGNRAFHRNQYKRALDEYIIAERLMGGDVAGMYLIPNQRSQLVKILSNQSECYLRMKKYEHALVQSTIALKLDKTHPKSILRRVKALYYGSNKESNVVMKAQLEDELQQLLDQDDNDTTNNKKEALDLMKQIQSLSE